MAVLDSKLSTNVHQYKLSIPYPYWNPGTNVGLYGSLGCLVLVARHGVLLRPGSLRFDHPSFGKSISNFDGGTNDRIRLGNTYPFGDPAVRLVHPRGRDRGRSCWRRGSLSRNRVRHLVLLHAKTEATRANARGHEAFKRRTDVQRSAPRTDVPDHARIAGDDSSPSTIAAALSILLALRPKPFQPSRQSMVAVFKL